MHATNNTVSSEAVNVPEGFAPLFRSSPFLDLIGPLFYREEITNFRVGMRVLPVHANSANCMHGGLIATLADISLGYVTAASHQPPLHMVTTSLTVDYVSLARLGSWVEACVVIDKTGKRLAFSHASIYGDNKLIATARAVFSVKES
jgi:acyl-coenzyme A thioesterase 13